MSIGDGNVFKFTKNQHSTDNYASAPEQGMNPPILKEPYVSTFCLLDEWFNYLKKGMEIWRTEAKAQSDLAEGGSKALFID
jgi:hypothetical protein